MPSDRTREAPAIVASEREKQQRGSISPGDTDAHVT
jgi:hypothetical protein